MQLRQYLNYEAFKVSFIYLPDFWCFFPRSSLSMSPYPFEQLYSYFVSRIAYTKGNFCLKFFNLTAFTLETNYNTHHVFMQIIRTPNIRFDFLNLFILCDFYIIHLDPIHFPHPFRSAFCPCNLPCPPKHKI